MAGNSAMTDGSRGKNRLSALRHSQRPEAARRRLTVKITDAGRNAGAVSIMEWRSIATAPFDRDLELAVINYKGTHTFVFPCRRILGGWMKAETNTPIILYPTHWREWHSPR